MFFSLGVKPEIISAVAGGSLGIHGMCLGYRVLRVLRVLRVPVASVDGLRWAMTGDCLNMSRFGPLGGH